MTPSRSFARAVLWGLLATIPALTSHAADFTLKLAYVAQPTNPAHMAMEYFAERVREKSGGKIELKLFHSGQLGGERDYVEGMQLGTVEMAVTSTGVLGAFDKSIDILSLPFLFRSSEHMDRTLDGPIGQELASKFVAKGFRVLGFADFGARYLYDSKRNILTPEDMKGLKFRAIENPIFLDTYAALGARAIPMARPEVYSALKQGVLDGLDNSIAFYKSMGDFEVAPYLTLGVQLFQTPAAVMISEKSYSRLPGNLKQALQAAATEAVAYERKLIRESDEATLAELKTKGVKPVMGDPKLFEEPARKVWDKYADQIGGRQRIEAVLQVQ